MDTIKNPFLFFYIFLTSFSLTSPGICHAQQTRDSLRYYYGVILSPEKSTDLQNGINYYLQQKEQDIINHDTLGVINDLRMISIGQFKIGYNYDSESTVVEALSLINKSEYKDTMINSRIGLYNQLGNIYRILSNSTKAIDAFDEALNLSRKAKDSITILNNKANIYKDLKEFELARDQYSVVYEKNMREGNRLQLAMTLDNLGFVQSKIDSPDALNNINKALDIRMKENDLTGIYSSYRSLAYYFLDRNDKEKALFYANMGHEVVKKINSTSYTQDVLSLFMDLNSDPKVVEYRRLTDSIAKAKQMAENKNAFIKYNLEEEQKKTVASKLQQEREKRLKLLYQGVTVLILIVLITSYFVFRYRYKRGKIEQVYKTETRISKKVHDEVANGVYHIMTRLQDAPDADERVLDELEDIYIKTRDISKENSSLDVSKKFATVLNDLLVSYNAENIKVITRNLSKIDWNSVSDLKKIAIFRVLQELMTNMKKHSKASITVLTFEKVKKRIIIHYSDNGIGCELVKGNGLQNVENRIIPLSGSITFDSKLEKGFKAKITI